MGNLQENEETSDLHSESAIVVAVDDEQIILELYKATLASYCNLCTFSNARDAFQFISENKVSLVIVDRHIPGMSGDELCTRLRTQPKTQNIPIIVVSGILKDIEEIAEMMTKKSIETYLTKPISINRLISNVQFYLNKGKNRKAESSVSIDDM